MILHTIYEVNKLSFSIKLTLGNAGLSNVKANFGLVEPGRWYGADVITHSAPLACVMRPGGNSGRQNLVPAKFDGVMPKQA
jgi:hypothetical protein